MKNLKNQGVETLSDPELWFTKKLFQLKLIEQTADLILGISSMDSKTLIRDKVQWSSSNDGIFTLALLDRMDKIT